MQDLLFISAIVGFFLLALAYLHFCEKLKLGLLQWILWILKQF